jgi:hypothetical protein
MDIQHSIAHDSQHTTAFRMDGRTDSIPHGRTVSTLQHSAWTDSQHTTAFRMDGQSAYYSIPHGRTVSTLSIAHDIQHTTAFRMDGRTAFRMDGQSAHYSFPYGQSAYYSIPSEQSVHYKQPLGTVKSPFMMLSLCTLRCILMHYARADLTRPTIITLLMYQVTSEWKQIMLKL